MENVDDAVPLIDVADPARDPEHDERGPTREPPASPDAPAP
jgi:hypothetical protein